MRKKWNTPLLTLLSRSSGVHASTIRYLVLYLAEKTGVKLPPNHKEA